MKGEQEGAFRPSSTLADSRKVQVKIGKRVGGSLYIHKEALPLLGASAEPVRVAERVVAGELWNVAKIQKTGVSLLLYESFDEPFPSLLASTRVDLATSTVTRTDYRRRENPPILHRKELLLPPDDPRLPRFRALTAAAEDHGLFQDSNVIGTRAAWNALIHKAGLTVRDGRLVRADEETLDVARHRTAIVRRDLSQPMQLMMRFGIVCPGRSLFDYGCGQGEDVEALASEGIEAFGWDPHHAPRGARRQADVVNLGFVLNVIEDPRERVETLKAAWDFAQRALCVAVMLQGKSLTAAHRPYRDGFVTSRGTFQKYFAQQELQEIVAAGTGQPVLALAPGIVMAFRDKGLEQEVLLRRRSRALLTDALPRPPERQRVVVARPSVRERLAGVLEQLRTTALAIGRLPEPEEAPREVVEALAAQRVGWGRVIDLLGNELSGDEAFACSRESRRDDLRVHIALLQFPGSPKYRSLPKSIQADIRAFFRNLATAQEDGRRLLFAAGDRAGIRQDVERALASGLGGMRGDRWFRFRASTLPRLPARLRVLVGCAEVLQGGVDACDFVDIDLEAPRIAMVTCDDIARPIPFMVERIIVDLARQRVSADRREPLSTPIYFKARFLTADDELKAGQERIESDLISTGLFSRGLPEPAWDAVQAALMARSPDTIVAGRLGAE